MDAIMALPLDSLDRATHLLEEVRFVLIREHAIFPYIEVTIFDGRSLLRYCVPDLAQDSWAPFVNSGAYLFGLLDALQLRHKRSRSNSVRERHWQTSSTRF